MRARERAAAKRRAKANKPKRVFKTPPTGRPTVFTLEILQGLLEWMKSGKTMTSYCKKHGLATSGLFNYMNKEGGESFKSEFTRAREDGAHALIDETIEIADEKSKDAMRQKLRVDTRMKIAGMWNRKQFGTRPGDADGANKLTLGELVEAAIAHGKQLEAQQAAKQLIDITPSAETPASLHAMRDLAHAALAPPTDQVQRRTRRAAS